MPRGKDQQHRRRPGPHAEAGGGAGGTPVADPAGFAKVIGRALAKRLPELAWRKGKLTAPYSHRRPRKATYEQLRKVAVLASVSDPGREAWWFFQEDYPPSKSEVLQKAAEDWGTSYSTLHRVVHGTCRSLSWRTIRCLRSHLSPTEQSQFDRALYSPAVREFFDHIEQEVARHRKGRTSRQDYRFTRAVREEVEAFKKLCDDQGMPPAREELARLRVFDPLVAHSTIRRRHRFPHNETLELVRLGYRRERLLLRAEKRLLTEGEG